MKIEEYNLSIGNSLDPVVLDASLYLERHGSIFLMNFNLENAVDKAAKMFTDFLEEDWFPPTYNGWT